MNTTTNAMCTVPTAGTYASCSKDFSDYNTVPTSREQTIL